MAGTKPGHDERPGALDITPAGPAPSPPRWIPFRRCTTIQRGGRHGIAGGKNADAGVSSAWLFSPILELGFSAAR